MTKNNKLNNRLLTKKKKRILEGDEVEQTVSGNTPTIYKPYAYYRNMDDAKSFLNNWYSNDTTRNMVGQLNPNLTLSPMAYRNTPDGKTRWMPEYDESGNIKTYTLPNSNARLRYGVSQGLTTPVVKENLPARNGIQPAGDFKGAFIDGRPIIRLDKRYSDSFYTPLHEYDHAIQQYNPFLLQTTQPVKHELKPGIMKDPEYLDNMNETRSRIMEARAFFNLNPDKRDYTPEEAAQMQEELRKSGKQSLMDLDRLTPETLANYLNYLALNNQDPTSIDTMSRKMIEDGIVDMPSENNTVSYAANGGRINKFPDGGKMKEASSAVAKKAFSGENIGGTIASGLSTAMTLTENAMKNAEVDTSSADNAIAATNAFQTDNSSLDALANSYDSAPWASTDYNFKDFRPGAGELAMNTLSSVTSGLSAGASMGGPWGAIGGAAIGLGSALGGIFAGRAKAKKEEARLEAEAKLANQSIQARAEASRDALIQQQANQKLMNVAAYGGSLGNFSGDFSNGVMFIDEGGTHEQNPFEGVPMGFDNEGTPNLVEQGELIYKDYVFSNRLKANKKGLENIGFSDKYKDWTFAKIAEDLQKESAERPNDILSKQTLDDMMNRLISVQEEVRMKKKQREQNKFNLGGKVNKFDEADGTLNTGNTDTNNTQIPLAITQIRSALPGINIPAFDGSDYDPVNPFGKIDYVSRALNEIKGNEITDDFFNSEPFHTKYSTTQNDDFHRGVITHKLVTDSKDPEDPEKKPFDWTKFGNDVLRIGAPLAAGISALAQNLAKPDYSQNERALNEARTAPTSNIVAPTEDISIRPVDTNYMTNMLRNQGNTAISNINNTAINAQQAMANQMLANNQLQGQLANAYVQANEANLNRNLQESEFNRGNDQFRTQTAFQNFANNAARHNTIVGATAQAAAANSALDAARAQGLLASESNLAESLAGIGSENHWAGIVEDAPWLLYDSQGRYKNPVETIGAPITPTTTSSGTAASGKHGGRLLSGDAIEQTISGNNPITYNKKTHTNITPHLNIQHPSLQNINFLGEHNYRVGTNKSGEEVKFYNTQLSSNELNNRMSLVTPQLTTTLGNTIDYVNNIYNTNRAKRMMNRANRYAAKQEGFDGNIGFNELNNVVVTDNTYDNSFFKPESGTLELGANSANGITTSMADVIAHELAHRNKIYNSGNPTYISDKNKKLLSANRFDEELDRQLNEGNPIAIDLRLKDDIKEQYADLMALRQSMYEKGIIDGTQRLYTNRDIRNYIDKIGGSNNNRYLQYRITEGDNVSKRDVRKDIRNVRKALNRVYADGGDMSTIKTKSEKLLTENKKRRK